MFRHLNFDRKFKKIKQELIDSKEHKYGPSGKLIVSSAGGTTANPWLLIQKARRKFCHYYWQIYSQKAGLIPEFCRFQCWKVMVSLTVQPNDEMPTGRFGTVEEAFMLYNIMRILDLPSKIGMDVRPYTYGIWKAYFYGDTLEEAREYYSIVKPVIDEHFAPGVTVVITRGCTEMNSKLASRYWDVPPPPEEVQLERKLNNLIEFEEFNWQLSEEIKQDTKEWWIETAIQMGDPTAQKVVENLSNVPDIWKRLVVHSDTYHETDPREELDPEEQALAPSGPLAAGEMLNYFDEAVESMGLTNEDVTEFLKVEALSREIADCMDIMDVIIASGDPSLIDGFLDNAKDWAASRKKEQTSETSAKPKKVAPKKKKKVLPKKKGKK